MSTVAPGTSAPDESRTVPVTLAVTVWPPAVDGARHRHAASQSRRLQRPDSMTNLLYRSNSAERPRTFAGLHNRSARLRPSVKPSERRVSTPPLKPGKLPQLR